MLIVQITDVHLLARGLLHDQIDTAANLGAVVARVADAALAPDLLLLTGDLAEDGAPETYRALRRAIDPLAAATGAEVLYVPGNHDDRAAFRAELLGVPAGAGPGEPIDQVVMLDGLRVIALDTVVPGEIYGELRDAQLAWLRAELARPAPAGSLVALHHPPVPSPIELMSRIALRDPDRLAATIEGSDVRLVVAGHYHHSMAATLAGVPVFVCPATSYLADVLIGPGCFRSLPGVAFGRIDLDDLSVRATAVPVGTEAVSFATVSSHDLGLD